MSVQTAANRNTLVSRRLRAILESQLQEAADAIAARHVELGRRIKTARDQKLWKQKELAHEVHVEPTTVSRWERGVHAPDMATLYLIAEKTGKPVGFFVADLDLGDPALAEATTVVESLERRLATLEDAFAGFATKAELEAGLESLRQAIQSLATAGTRPGNASTTPRPG